jgi:HSP20 family protein
VTHGVSRDAMDLAEDARRLLVELDRDVPSVAQLTAECRPPIDVLETASAIEIVVDLPGVRPESIRVAVRRNTLLVVGAKIAPPCEADSRYHLAERSYGRFARAVRFPGAIDAAQARATTQAGELHVVLPRLSDRRGSILQIPVQPA